VRSRPWDRAEVIGRVRRDVWRYLTEAARTDDEIILNASALLQMPSTEVRTLAQLQFVLSNEVADLLADMPRIVRRLTTTSRRETEMSVTRVRGPIVWSETFSARAATGLPHVYVTAPAKRAFDTPENHLLRFSLATVAQFGRRTGWHRASGVGVGAEVRRRVNEAARWLSVRSLAEIPTTPISAATLSRVRSSRRRRNYRSAISTYTLYQRFIKRLDRLAIQNAVEQHALVTSQDSTLLELLAAFTVVRALRRLGWEGSGDRLVTPRLFRGYRRSESIDVYYQHTPRALSEGSIYRHVQRTHGFSAIGGLIPDLVMRVESATNPRWILVEVKGLHRPVQDSARAAVQDLLAYRRAFSPMLDRQSGAYGVGVAWGEQLKPSGSAEILLCSPDTITDALERVI
jgi:hypothetical protein